MFFCEKCRFMFNVTKDAKNKQVGGKTYDALRKIFEKYSVNEKLQTKDLDNVTPNDLMNDPNFESLTKKDQRRFKSWVKSTNKNFFDEKELETKKGSNIAYFICKYCKNYEPIKPTTLIYSKNYGPSKETEDYTYAIYDHTLMRTKVYICKNTKCETHKNSENKEAVITKNSMDQIVYVCTVCTTNWVNSL